MSLRQMIRQATAYERVRRAERGREEANAKECAKHTRPDSINWKDGTVWRCIWGWQQCGEVLKDGRITWYGKIAGRVVDGKPVYRKEYEVE